MMPLESWIGSPAVQSLGWTLLHSLWQGAFAAAALGAALQVWRAPRARYAAACLAMLAMAAGFAVTLGVTIESQRSPLRFLTAAGAAARVPALAGPGAPAIAAHGVEAIVPWLVPFWVAGVCAFSVRGVGRWAAARRLVRRGVCLASEPWPRRLHDLAARLRLSRPVLLLESCLAEVPVVIGHLRPVILLPVGLLAGLPAPQVEAILLHELAHVRRCDYLLNLLQTALEGLLFYHPATWWISAVIRAEREHCCDDLAVAACGDAHAYAVALAGLEQTRTAAVPAATGGSLVKRIRRLLDQPEGPRASWTPVVPAAVVAIAAVMTLAAWQAPPPAPAADPYTRWLNEDVIYIVTAQERAAFLALRTDAERDHFIEQFWLRRDPTPGTPANEFKQEHYRRIAQANRKWAFGNTPGWKSDRGRMYILYGPPDEIESHPAGGSGTPYPYEQWLYRQIPSVGERVIMEFVDPGVTGQFQMTRHLAVALPENGKAVLSIPLAAYGDHRVVLAGQVLTSDSRPVQSFDDAAQGPAPFSKSLALAPGAYRVRVVVRDPATGTLANYYAEFQLK